LLVLDASIELASRRGRRLVPMDAFIDGYRHTQCRSDEIVTAILVPKRSTATRSHFLKLGARRYLVISIVMAAGVVELDAAGRIGAARVAVGSCSAIPQRLPVLEAALIGQPPLAAAESVAASHFEGLSPIDDIRGSARYRREAALTLTQDLLGELAADKPRRPA
jgi:N-methylhydantoinase B